MNEKQKAIVDTFGQGLAVVAGAGCGKTTTLVAKCRELLARNPKARFCAVSFTEKSVRDLRTSLTEKLGGLDLSDHWVKTIHGLCASILQEFPVAAGLQGGERILIEDEAGRLWNRSLEVLWSSNDNPEISESLDRLLQVYSRDSLEGLFRKLRSLVSFGVEEFITRSLDRPEVVDLWRVFGSVYQRYQQSKNRDGGLDFNDLEIRADQALRDPRVRAYFHSRFDLVMVDEFQDTNPLQGRILEAFVKPGLTNLCIVGDPKQSIYRFRDADVSVFQDLTSRLPSRHILDENYRSRAPIIDFVNRVCAPAFEASLLPYEPLVARKESAGSSGSQDQECVSMLEWSQESDLADFLAAERARGVDLSEFVILARSVRGPKTQAFLKALDEKNIPILLASGGGFYEDPRVREAVALLRGWCSPGNAISQVTALRAPWIGVADSWLLETATQGREYFERFFEESPHPIARALAPMYLGGQRLTCLRPGQVLSELLQLKDLDEEVYFAWVSLWHKAEELSRQGLRFEAVVAQLAEAIENEKIEKEVPAPAEQGMVRVMTIHGSKGLQFPRVILLDFEGPSRNQNRTGDLIWDRKLGVHLLHRDEDGATLKDDPTNLKWKELEKSATVAESKRVFYVALTRAQEALILVWKKDVKESKKSSEPGYSPYLEDHWRAWVKEACASQMPGTIALGQPSGDSGQPKEESGSSSSNSQKQDHAHDPKPYRARHSPSEWLILNQCARRYRRRFTPEPDQSSKEWKPRELVTEEPDFRALARGTDRNAIAEKGERIHRLIEERRDDELVAEFASPEVGQKAVSELRAFLAADDGAIRSFNELGFEAPLSGHEALVGMMDRLEVDFETRSIRVIDYKFTARPETPEKLLGHYALQLKLYAWAASRLLPFKPARIEGALVHFTEGSGTIIPATEGKWDLPSIEAEVSRLFASAKGADETPTPGDHCRYCEVRAGCPSVDGNALVSGSSGRSS